VIIGSKIKQAVEKKVREVGLQPTTVKGWLRDKLAPPKALTKEERRALMKKEAEFHGRISDLWED